MKFLRKSKTHVALVIALVLQMFLGSSLGVLGQVDKSKDEKKREARLVKAKEAVFQAGMGKDAKLKLQLYDRSVVKGYVESRTDDSFVLVDKSGTKREIAYSDVRKIKGKGLPAGAWAALGAAAGFGVFGLAIIYAQSKN